MQIGFPTGRWLFLLAVAAASGLAAGPVVRVAPVAPASLNRHAGRLEGPSAPKRFDIPWTDGEVGSVRVDGAPRRFVKWWQVSSDGRTVRVALDWVTGGEPPAVVTLEGIASTGQMPDGRWQFRVADAHTKTAPKGQRFHEWDLEATRGGNYTVELVGGAWDERTEAVEVTLCGQTRPGQLDFLDGRNRVASKPVGRIRIPGAGPQLLRVQVGEADRSLRGELKALVLRPAPEGARSRPDASGGFVLRAGDAALNGRSMTVVGWGDTATVSGWNDDAASLGWDCEEVRAGRYRVELVASAGPDVEGDLEVRVAGQALRTPLATGGRDGNAARALGEVEVTRAGDQPVVLQARGARGRWGVSAVRLVRLP